MPHKGKDYERLFARDLSPYTNNVPPWPFWAKKYKANFTAGVGDLGSWPAGFVVSADGQWDYDLGYVWWVWTNPTPHSPLITVTYRWYLSHDVFFQRFQGWVEYNGVAPHPPTTPGQVAGNPFGLPGRSLAGTNPLVDGITMINAVPLPWPP